MSALFGWHAVLERDGERVQCRLPAHCPSCLTGALGVQGSGDQVEHLHRGLLVGEVAAGPYGATVAGVEALDRVRAAEDLSDLDVVIQEGDELLPRRAP